MIHIIVLLLLILAFVALIAINSVSIREQLEKESNYYMVSPPNSAEDYLITLEFCDPIEYVDLVFEHPLNLNRVDIYYSDSEYDLAAEVLEPQRILVPLDIYASKGRTLNFQFDFEKPFPKEATQSTVKLFAQGDKLHQEEIILKFR